METKTSYQIEKERATKQQEEAAENIRLKQKAQEENTLQTLRDMQGQRVSFGGDSIG